jgi:hypothetical protein
MLTRKFVFLLTDVCIRSGRLSHCMRLRYHRRISSTYYISLLIFQRKIPWKTHHYLFYVPGIPEVQDQCETYSITEFELNLLGWNRIVVLLVYRRGVRAKRQTIVYCCWLSCFSLRTLRGRSKVQIDQIDRPRSP